MSRACSLYPDLPVFFFPAQDFKQWAVWQNENHSVAVELEPASKEQLFKVAPITKKR